MPITIASDIRILNQEQFHAIDRRVMGIIFAVHNEFGRLLDEQLYEAEISARCKHLELIPTEGEVRIRVTHDTFTKDYFMDLVVCRGVMVELKVAEKLVPAHRTQALNYLLLTGMHHARLVNLRPNLVEHEFVSTQLTPEMRKRFRIEDEEWSNLGPRSLELRARVTELLNDIGPFLDIALYREAVVHLLGGVDAVTKQVEIRNGSRIIGKQKMNLLDEECAFALTAVRSGQEAMADHFLRFLKHSNLQSIQWVNFNRHEITLKTLSRKA